MPSTKPTIIIVDDDEVDRRRLTRALAKQGIENPTVMAEDGKAALELLRRKGDDAIPWPYLVVVDINMPRMDGLEFLAALRADRALRHVVVIVLSSSDDDRDLITAYQRGAAGYVLKTRPGASPGEIARFVGVYAETVLFPPHPGPGSNEATASATREVSP